MPIVGGLNFFSSSFGKRYVQVASDENQALILLLMVFIDANLFENNNPGQSIGASGFNYSGGGFTSCGSYGGGSCGDGGGGCGSSGCC